MMLPCVGRERNTLSHRWMPIRGGDGTSMELKFRPAPVNIAQIPKFNELEHLSYRRTRETLCR
jgi:hypothetical protein